MFKRMDHVGIVVNDIDATIAELQEFVAVVEGLLPSNTKSGES